MATNIQDYRGAARLDMKTFDVPNVKQAAQRENSNDPYQDANTVNTENITNKSIVIQNTEKSPVLIKRDKSTE